ADLPALAEAFELFVDAVAEGEERLEVIAERGVLPALGLVGPALERQGLFDEVLIRREIRPSLVRRERQDRAEKADERLEDPADGGLRGAAHRVAAGEGVEPVLEDVVVE